MKTEVPPQAYPGGKETGADTKCGFGLWEEAGRGGGNGGDVRAYGAVAVHAEIRCGLSVFEGGKEGDSFSPLR